MRPPQQVVPRIPERESVYATQPSKKNSPPSGPPLLSWCLPVQGAPDGSTTCQPEPPTLSLFAQWGIHLPNRSGCKLLLPESKAKYENKSVLNGVPWQRLLVLVTFFSLPGSAVIRRNRVFKHLRLHGRSFVNFLICPFTSIYLSLSISEPKLGAGYTSMGKGVLCFKQLPLLEGM